jgi:hypothetical protein
MDSFQGGNPNTRQNTSGAVVHSPKREIEAFAFPFRMAMIVLAYSGRILRIVIAFSRMVPGPETELVCAAQKDEYRSSHQEETHPKVYPEYKGR